MINSKELASLISGSVDTTPETLDRASHDASIFEIVPEAVVAPANVDDLKKLVKYATENAGVHLAARSAGTDMSGGPLTDSIVVEFPPHFNKLIEVGEGYAITQPGVYYRDFEKATLEKGYLMPSYPASRELCTVGGIVANNSGGEKTLTYGKTERYVRRIKMVLADGNEVEFKALSKPELEKKLQLETFEGDVYRKMHSLIDENYDLLKQAKPAVSKNSCGYYLWNVWDNVANTFDLTKMIVGSQGTLGLITEIEFGLVKPKTHSRLLVIFLKDLKLLGVTATEVLKYKPESFESYDDHTFKVALKFLPQLMKQMGGNIITLGLHFFPEMLAVIESGGVPKLVLMAEFTGETDAEAERKALEAQESLKKFHERTRVTTSESDSHKYWVIRRESFNMLRHHVKELRTAPFIDDFAVKPITLPEFLPKLYNILDKYKLTYTIAGHVGDGNFHIIPLMNLHEQHSHDVIKELSVKVYELVHEFGGTITAEHNDGLIRTPFIKMQYGPEVYKLFEEVKKIWDPKGIFNPGKKVGTTWDEAVKKIVN
jgi:FAD/FMN-containing dehydrogenase